MGQQGPAGANKMTFFKNDPGPQGMPKQVFLARFELVVARFGPPKIPKCLENGLFRDKKNGSKMGQKCVFPKMILYHLGCTNKWNEPTKWLKNGSKPWFSKNDPSPIVVPKRMNTAHFEPPLSCSHPLSSAYLICR